MVESLVVLSFQPWREDHPLSNANLERDAVASCDGPLCQPEQAAVEPSRRRNIGHTKSDVADAGDARPRRGRRLCDNAGAVYEQREQQREY
jgi:hypothetical protein